MKKICSIIFFCAALVGCGGSAAPTFDGVWNGSFTSLQNDCPFSVAQNINPLFPMTVSVDENDVFTVVAVDGSTATGGQGPGETISFLAQSPKFGNYGSIAPYTCASILSGVGYLTQGDNQAKVTVTITFTDCNTPGSTSNAVTCGAIYYGDATRS